MVDWYSEENLRRAWKYAKQDIRDDFVFDVIDYADVRHNVDLVVSALHTQIRDDQYYPAPLISIDVPKHEHSVRPGTVIPLVDLVVLYAIAQQLAPLLDPFLSESAYAYRLNPKAHKSGASLFTSEGEPKRDEAADDSQEQAADEEQSGEAGFPYNWFASWRPFDIKSKAAAKQHDHVAVTDITAFFENIALDSLREILKEKLNTDQRELIDRLFRLLEFWDWTPSGNLPRGIGLPQGNDVSSFLSNLYLMDLDEAMLTIVFGDSSKYYRYVDDVRLFTSDRDQARQALVKLEAVLRTLNLNVQSAKTKIKPADKLYDPRVTLWVDKLSDDEPNRAEYAVEFFDDVFDRDALDTWQRPYLRCLTHLRAANDDRAVDTALDLFLTDPSSKLLTKHLIYLRHFVTSRAYGKEIVQRLNDDTFTFPYHRAVMFRLAAYSRDLYEELKQLALAESNSSKCHWFCRMAALFCLGTFPLSPQELAQVARIIGADANSQVLRAAFVVLCQHSGRELSWVLDRLSLFNAPHQDYLRRYFFRLYSDHATAMQHLSRVKGASVDAPTFVHNLHRLDLLKASSNAEQRTLFKEVLEAKIEECKGSDWPRLTTRLEQVFDSFVLKPSE